MENKKELSDKKRSILSFILYFVVSFVGALVIEVIILLISYLLTGDINYIYEHKTANYIASALTNFLCYLMLITVVIYLGLKFFKEDQLEFKKYKYFYLLGAFLIFVAVYVTQIISSLFYELINVTGDSENQEAIVNMLKSSPFSLFITFIAVVFLGPIVEEFIFRKCLFNIINIDWLSIIVSGIIFGLIHVISGGDYIMSIPYILSGIMFAVGYKLCNKNIYPSIIAHMVLNLFSVYAIMYLT